MAVASKIPAPFPHLCPGCRQMGLKEDLFVFSGAGRQALCKPVLSLAAVSCLYPTEHEQPGIRMAHRMCSGKIPINRILPGSTELIPGGGTSLASARESSSHPWLPQWEGMCGRDRNQLLASFTGIRGHQVPFQTSLLVILGERNAYHRHPHAGVEATLPRASLPQIYGELGKTPV